MMHSDREEPPMENERLHVDREHLMSVAAELVRFDEITIRKRSGGMKEATYVMDGSYSRDEIDTIKKAVWVLNHCEVIADALKTLNDVMDKQNK